jgi:thiamine biosynthesis lipoprotein
MADAFATSFMVMGLEKAKRVLAQHPELQAYFIFSQPDGKLDTWVSDSLKQYIGE